MLILDADPVAVWGLVVAVIAAVASIVAAVEESVDLAYEIYNRVFRKIPEILRQNEGVNR